MENALIYRLAEGSLEAGRPLEALELLAPLVDELRDTAAGALLLGRAYYRSAQLRRAEETLTKAVELAPSDPYARYLLGRTLQRQSRHADALPHLRLAAAQDPAYAEDRDACAARLAG
ncbi:tetratricopeptide repeat protein [Pseudonocardia sp. RS11V-5]|uniref:tetratricopeptide repeat protein n=1 Tax=Pseudonocardia terrae TaxID=2905831 RepID=UPI001E40E2E3|nr:tetratricopeptide repeat protein [Pseudonocardia terrae]MCE3552631.1 tetratricopeptide repeat protein [Pseudonocardia terrae]